MSRDDGRGRTSRRFRRLKEQLRALRLPCYCCGQAIDYDAPWWTPGAFTVDHVQPLSVAPDLAEEWTNLRPSRRDCNVRRGNRPIVRTDLGRTSREW